MKNTLGLPHIGINAPPDYCSNVLWQRAEIPIVHPILHDVVMREMIDAPRMNPWAVPQQRNPCHGEPPLWPEKKHRQWNNCGGKVHDARDVLAHDKSVIDLKRSVGTFHATTIRPAMREFKNLQQVT